MRAALVAAGCLIGAIAMYVAWIAAAADDYTGGAKHFAAVTTGLLCLAFIAGLVAAVVYGFVRWLRERSPNAN